MTRPTRLALGLAILLLFVLAPAFPVAADDTTAPDGSFAINAGDEWTNDTHLDLDVAATDDVGVVTVKVRHAGGDWTTYPYAAHIDWDAGSIPDGPYQLEVEWRDAAGNGDAAFDSINYDSTAPVLAQFAETTPGIGPAGTVTFQFGLTETTGFGMKARFSSNGGSTWGALVPLDNPQIAWDPFDTDHGGSPSIGPRTVSAQVRDPAGNWSNVKSDTINVTAEVSIDVSSNPTTGQSITFTPQWSSPVSFPAGTYCSWEFMTGNDRALFAGEHDETYSYNQTQGAKSGGWCGPWTFTLPWSPVRQYLVAYRVMFPDGSEAGAELGAPGVKAFTSTVGSTSRAITSSNLPLFYILPDDDPMTVGVPTTYRAFAVGGASIKSTDRWMVVPSTNFYPGASTFTFTPTRTGHVSVCLARQAGSTPMGQLTACLDPTVGRGSGTVATPGPTSGATDAAATGMPAATGLPAPSDGPAVTPGAVAIATGGPAVTNEPPAAPSAGPIAAAPSATVPWVVVGLAVVVLGGGVMLLLRPELRTTLRTRFRR